MAEKLVRRATAFEFFREQLVEALDHQKVSASEFTEYYLVNLLAAFTQGDRMPGREPGYDEVPLALLYLRALGVSRRERARRLRAMADTALFVSGFFTDSLTGRDGVLRYYVTLGGQAYARLGRDPEEDGFVGPEVFTELALHFRDFVDVLAEVSEKSRATTAASVISLYERWLQTGSRRAAALLARQGILPMPPSGGGPQ
jgi:hypothetical protein